MMNEDVNKSNSTKSRKVIISLLIGSSPLFLIFFTLFVSVFLALGLFELESDAGWGTNNNYINFVSGSGDALYDGSLSRDDFIEIVNNYEPPNIINGNTERSYAWGYETFFKANAGNFYDIAVNYGLDPRFIFSIGIHESAYGTSNIALEKGNFFGWGAYDASPYESALTFYDMSDGIETVASGIANNYVSSNGAYHNTIINNGLEPSSIAGIGSVYASDTGWSSKVINYIVKIFNANFNPVESKPITLNKLSSYPLNGTGASILNSQLSQSQISSLNNYINMSINESKYGTGSGVAAAGQALTYGLYQMGYILPYSWGGGHSGVSVGFNNSWGVGGNGLDCSSFVSWAIVNGCNDSFPVQTSDQFYNLNVSTTSIENAQPGDIMVKRGHVRLVIYSSGASVIVAEEYNKKSGLIFKSYSSIEAGYKILDMSSWYSNNCKG